MLKGSDLASIGQGGGGSKRLAAYQAAQAKRENGGRLEVEDVKAVLAHQEAGRVAQRVSLRQEEPAAPRATQVPPSAPAAQTVSPAQIHTAANQARAAERARWSTVFASEHSRGRERGCVSLLTAADGWSVSQIVAKLQSLPTDERLADDARAAKHQASAAMWDKVWDEINGRRN